MTRFKQEPLWQNDSRNISKVLVWICCIYICVVVLDWFLSPAFSLKRTPVTSWFSKRPISCESLFLFHYSCSNLEIFQNSALPPCFNIQTQTACLSDVLCKAVFLRRVGETAMERMDTRTTDTPLLIRFVNNIYISYAHWHVVTTRLRFLFRACSNWNQWRALLLVRKACHGKQYWCLVMMAVCGVLCPSCFL